MIVMKKHYVLSGIIVLTVFSCIRVADTTPGLSIYKTKGDYFNKAFVFKKSSGIYMVPAYYNSRYNTITSKIKITDTDTVYTRSIKLIDGYILAAEGSKDMAFLSFTFKEYLRYEIKNGHHPTDEELLNGIIDDPFIEFYYDPQRPRRFELSDTAEINQIIRNGELEKYFKRIKL